MNFIKIYRCESDTEYQPAFALNTDYIILISDEPYYGYHKIIACQGYVINWGEYFITHDDYEALTNAKTR